MAAFRGLKGFNGQSSVKTWLTSILMKRAAKMWNKQRHIRRTISLHAEPRPHNGNAESGGSLAERLSRPAATLAVDQRLDLLEMIRSLPAEFREALVLRDVEGMKYQEIAAALGIPIGTVESRIHRARAELRTKLAAYSRGPTRPNAVNE